MIFILFFSPDSLSLFYISASRNPKFPANKKNKTPFVKGSAGVHRTRVQDPPLKNDVSIWDFVRTTGISSIVALQLLCFSVRSTLRVKYDMVLALSSQIFEYLRDFFSDVFCHYVSVGLE